MDAENLISTWITMLEEFLDRDVLVAAVGSACSNSGFRPTYQTRLISKIEEQTYACSNSYPVTDGKLLGIRSITDVDSMIVGPRMHVIVTGLTMPMDISTATLSYS